MIVIELDVIMARRKMSLKMLSQITGITESNCQRLKMVKVRNSSSQL